MDHALRQHWPLPSSPRPIVIFGAGGIVSDAHMPAYRLAGLPVAGVYDVDASRAEATASRWGIAQYRSVDEAAAVADAVFDLALPPAAHLDILPQLPAGAAVLMQKPMGSDLAGATKILTLARERQLTAAVNFQLRFAPMMLAIADARSRGFFGEIVDIEMHLNLMTPWNLWPFLKGMKRVEIAVHSIHYLDLIRSLVGDPLGVHAKTLGHPSTEIAQTRTSAILDYGDRLRCILSINHNHDFARKFQSCWLRVEGMEGVAMAKLGVNLNYPEGEPDELWLCRKGGDWQSVPLEGTWFPHAFIGTMANLQRFAVGEDAALSTRAEDAWSTMALVEACFRSSATPATPIEARPEV
ncbi:Gfo/Idh/MocA family protein [Mangrovicella endophytica]|uniref:Gfo/Idh/MocA family protein n=1 Tax=Mangrovicella endophytica TaxID=2066697 RepID=UPI001FE0E129|nr:Gfo/Idh/MocA family oxidoreductase [Mangrovicella endophytica]